MTCHDDDFKLGPVLLDRFQYLPTIHFWHKKIGDDEIKGFCFEEFKSFLSIFYRKDLITLLGQGLTQGPSDQILVVCNQNLLFYNRFLLN